MLMLLLFATGIFAGLVDAIAGGGGLISLPILISTGMPPQVAFGTNKLQGTLGTFVAARHYHRQGLIEPKLVYWGVFFGIFGAAAGSIAAQVLGSQVLRQIIPVLLFAVLIYTVFSPKLGFEDKAPRMNQIWFYALFGFALAFYDGFFGPGAGSFWVFFLTFFLGYNLIKATAYTKVFNLNSSLIASISFIIGGNIDYRVVICMAAGQFIGGRLGAHLAIRSGAKIIRPIFLSVVSLTIGGLVYKSYASFAPIVQRMQSYGITPQVVIALLLLVSIFIVYRRVRGDAS